MLQALLLRKASPLGSYDWCTRPWPQKSKDQTPKDVFQKLYDHGFALAALLEEVDSADLEDKNVSTETIEKYLRRCSAMDAKFSLWYQELVQKSDGPIYWLTPLTDFIKLSLADEHRLLMLKKNWPFSFPNLKMASIILLYWALKLAISSTIANICSAALSAPKSPTPTPLETAATNLLVQHGDNGRLQNATNIMRSMPYCLHDSMGLMGAQKTIFALRAARLSLRKSQIEELKWCIQTYRSLYEKKGFGYAKQLVDMGPKWGFDPALEL